VFKGVIRLQTVLITGGAGFVGSHIARELIKRYEQIVVLDNLSTGLRSNIPTNEKIIFVEGDFSDRNTVEQLFSIYRFNYIYHLGAIASVAASIDNPLFTQQTNFQGTLNLLEAARKQGIVNRFIFASSASIYGNEGTLPKKENTMIQPQTPYAIDKFSSEQYVLAYHHLYGLPTTALRFFNIYGINQNPHSPYSGVISIMTKHFELKSKGENPTFTLFGSGQQTRDFVYVKDVVDASLLVATNAAAVGKVFNVGTGKAVSILDIIKIYEQISGYSLDLTYQQKRNGDIDHSYSDISLLSSLGYKPRYSIEEGLKEYWEEVSN
jgi:UDP-glucose 4-epimerase